MRIRTLMWGAVMAVFFLPGGASGHQLDSATATVWERIAHLFTSPDHMLALVGLVLVGGMLFWWRRQGAPFQPLGAGERGMPQADRRLGSETVRR